MKNNKNKIKISLNKLKNVKNENKIEIYFISK